MCVCEYYDQLQLLYVELQLIFKLDASFALVSFELRLAETESCMLSIVAVFREK